MSRINVYLPDDLAEAVKAAELNVSAVVQEALRAELGRSAMDRWLDSLTDLPHIEIPEDELMAAVDGGREDLGL